MLEINYPSCHITGEQEGKLAIAIKEAIAASDVLTEEQKQVKLWAFDHNPSDAVKYVKEVLSVDGANEALDGIAFHDYSGSLSTMQQVLDELLNQGERKDQTVNLTERSVWGTAGANSIITYLRNSAISYNSWVTMLDSEQKEHQFIGGVGVTMFVREAGSSTEYWTSPEYYIAGQFSSFIRPGYVRVDSDPGSEATVTNVVFKNPETNELVAVVVNKTAQKQNFKVVCGGTQFIGALPAGNIATFVWNQPENIHYNVEEGFSAVEYAGASEGVTVDETGYVTTSSGDDYIDYIVEIKEAGTYGIILDSVQSADGQKIGLYQGDTLLREVMAKETWDHQRVNVRVPVTFEKAGLQQLRIKMPAGVKLYNITLVETTDVHKVPGRIPADEYYMVMADGGNDIAGLTVNNAHQIENISAWSTISYKVAVSQEGTYALKVSSATTEQNSGYIIVVDGTEVQNVVSMDWGNNIPYTPSGSWDNFTTSGADITLTGGEHTIGFKVASSVSSSDLHCRLVSHASHPCV